MTFLADRSDRYDAWVATLAERASPWRVVLGLVLAGAVWLAILLPAVAVTSRSALPPERLGVVVFLLAFTGLVAGIGLATRWLHRLPGVRLLGLEGRLEAYLVWRSAALVVALFALTSAPLFLVAPPARQLDPETWALWAAAALPALFLQVTAEELVFRGYLQGMLATRTRNRLVWWVLPAVAFGALHWNPAEMGENAFLMVLAAILMGLVLGDVTARTGSLSAAIGLHFANNAFGVLVLATPSALSGLALYLSPLDTSDPQAVRMALIGNIALIAAAYAIYLVVARRRARRRGR
jgi:membrane protease YdiL (CAAX protease family)